MIKKALNEGKTKIPKTFFNINGDFLTNQPKILTYLFLTELLASSLEEDDLPDLEFCVFVFSLTLSFLLLFCDFCAVTFLEELL